MTAPQSRLWRLAFTITIATLLVTVGVRHPVFAQNAPPPRQAGYIEVHEEQVPVQLTLTGRAVAQNTTQLRPKVGGEVIAILYTPGQEVEAGDPMFALDPVTYQIALLRAEADLAYAKSDLTASQSAYDRAQKLRQSSTASQAAFEIAQTTLEKAQANEQNATAALTLARTQMSWTTIRAPHAGIAGVAQIALGDLVTANQTQALAEIVQIDPVYVDFYEAYPLHLAILTRADKGEITLYDTPQLDLLLDGDRRLENAGTLETTAATVSTTTGTRQLRFSVKNPDNLIAPGMFLHGIMTLGTQTAILVPQRATTRERDGSLAAWVSQDDVARKHILREVGTWGNAWIVQDGIAPGDKLLVDGTTNLRDGAALQLIPATIDANGVVRDDAPVSGN